MTFEICPHCKQKMAVYKRSIRKNMLPGLIALRDSNEPLKTIQLGLDAGARSDFTTLKYWGLIWKPLKEKRDLWAITYKGMEFLNNRIAVQKYIYVFNGNIEGRSDELIFAMDIDDKIFSSEELINETQPLSEFRTEDQEG